MSGRLQAWLTVARLTVARLTVACLTVACLTLAGLSTLGCQGGDQQLPAAGRGLTPVVLISLDTVRADAISRSSGSGGESLTPRIDALLDDSIVFPNAMSEIPFTLPAHLTMLTGTAPDVHGVFGEGDRLRLGIASLAEVLAAAGYSTSAVVSSDWLRPEFGFGPGFESYEPVDHGLEFADQVNDRGLKALDRMSSSHRPPLLFVHYYDAHSDSSKGGNELPYWAPEGDPTPDRSCPERFCSPEGECATGFLLWASHHPEEVSPETRECLFAGYLAGVRALDEGVGHLLDGLRSRGLYDSALIVLTSDHGEEFGEHGQFVHAQTHHESLAIPLAIKLPHGRHAGRSDPRLAQLADIAPTLLTALGLETPETATGRDLLAERRSDEADLAVAQNKHRPQRYALMEGRWKLIHDYVTDHSRLYDREADPGETRDVAPAHADIVEGLRARLDEVIRHHRQRRLSLGEAEPSEDPVLDTETRRRLEALGYVD